MTKTDIFLLGLTVLFVALAMALSWLLAAAPGRRATTVTAQRGDDSPRAAGVLPLNINTATAGRAGRLWTGIGQVLAQRIVDYRNANGPFAAVDDLLEVDGIGPGILESIRTQITSQTEDTQE